MSLHRSTWLLAAAVVSSGHAATNCSKYYECYEYEEGPAVVWQEEKLVLPAKPDPAKLIPFEVNVANTNRFFIDPASIAVGKDGVVRFTIVVDASGGARSVNYEGLRCETRERKLYAFGQADGSWVESKGSSWIPVLKQEHKMHNGYPAVLADEYFCVDRVPVASQAIAVKRLENGPVEKAWR